MTYEQQRKIAAEQKRRKQKRDNTFAWLFIIGVAVTIFALGTLFGWHLTSHTPQEFISTTQPTTGTTTTAYYIHPKTMELTTTPETVAKPTGVPGVSLDYKLQRAMYDYCQEYNVPFALALAVAEKESNFNPDATSKTDDHGLMQINACNFDYLRKKGIEPTTYEGNIEAGILLLSENLELYGKEDLAVMAYNCGRTGAKRLWAAGTYSTEYSRAVMEFYKKWLDVLEVQQ